MSSPSRRRIDEIGDESRRRILDAAEALISERGLERTSFVDIAERSGISRGSIPWHFKNKNGLVQAVLERAIERQMPGARYQQSTPLAEIFVDTAALVRDGESALLFRYLPEAMSGEAAARDAYRDFIARSREGVEAWLRSHRPDGVDPEAATRNEKALAAALHGALLGIHLQAVIDPGAFDLDAALRSVAALIDGSLDRLWAT